LIGVTRAGILLSLASTLVVAGCASASRAFFVDESVHITSPAPLTTVSAPFEVTWIATGSADRGYALFVDRSPIAPGHSVRDLATDQCKRLPNCQPDAGYLAGLGVFLTHSDEVTVPNLEPLAGTASREQHPVHTFTVVVMDSNGHRLGDAAWQGEFRG
jgi:hypothetical protein